MQQYFIMITNRVAVIIDDRLCKVDKDGKVWANSWGNHLIAKEQVDNYVKATA